VDVPATAAKVPAVTLTVTLPETPIGAVAMIWVGVHETIDAAGVEPKDTVPCVEPKFEPEIVTCVPGGPVSGATLVTVGGMAVTTKIAAPLDCPPTVTTTAFEPSAALKGTWKVMAPALQFVVASGTPANVSVPVAVPKLAPETVTPAVPAGPEAGERLVMIGTGAVTVKVPGRLAIWSAE
jgi:hypothetical protein